EMYVARTPSPVAQPVRHAVVTRRTAASAVELAATSADDGVGEVDRDGAVVGAPHVGVDRGVLEVVGGARAQEREVDAPADVLLAHAEALAPPGVVLRHVPSHRAEAVDPPARQPARELLALLGEKAAGLPVLLRAREIDLARRGVEVAHHDDRLTRALRRVE